MPNAPRRGENGAQSRRSARRRLPPTARQVDPRTLATKCLRGHSISSASRTRDTGPSTSSRSTGHRSAPASAAQARVIRDRPGQSLVDVRVVDRVSIRVVGRVVIRDPSGDEIAVCTRRRIFRPVAPRCTTHPTFSTATNARVPRREVGVEPNRVGERTNRDSSAKPTCPRVDDHNSLQSLPVQPRRSSERAWRTEFGRMGREKDGEHRSTTVTCGQQRSLENQA